MKQYAKRPLNYRVMHIGPFPPQSRRQGEGGFGGLRPPNKALSPPKLNYAAL